MPSLSDPTSSRQWNTWLATRPSADERRDMLLRHRRQVPPPVAIRFTSDRSRKVRVTLASTVTLLPPKALRTLAGDSDPEVRRALATRSDLPARYAVTLATDATTDVAVTAVRRHGHQPGVLAVGFRHSSSTVRAAAIGTAHGGIPAVLANDSTAYVREAFATHARITASLRDQLAADPEPVVVGALLGRSDVRMPQELVRAVAVHPDEWIRVRVARRPEPLPTDVWVTLVSDPDVEVAEVAAARVQVPTARVLTAAAAHSSVWVHRAMVNTATKRDVAVRHRGAAVRRMAAAHADLTPDQVNRLASDKTATVRRAMVLATDDWAVVDRLQTDPADTVRRAAARRWVEKFADVEVSTGQPFALIAG